MAGDLRPAHFVGIHALQILPLFGLAILKFFPGLSEARKELLVSNARLTYLGIILVLTFQALSAEPLLEPGYQTMHQSLASASGARVFEWKLWNADMNTFCPCYRSPQGP